MLRSIHLLLAAAPLIAGPALGAENPLALVHARAWDGALMAAAEIPDPVAVKLVTYFRMLTPGAAGPGEIAAFRAANPDWPNQMALEHRREEAIAAETDQSRLAAACADRPIALPQALAACAGAEAASGDQASAEADARAAWRSGLPAAEAGPFLKHFGGDLTPADEEARFDHLAWTDPATAAAEISRLPLAQRPAAQARVALAQNTPEALAKARALPASECCAPGLVLEELRAERHVHGPAAALDLWQQRGFAAEQQEPDHHAAFWAERNILARALLAAGDAQGAFTLADNSLPGASSADHADAAFLSGFIALRWLHDPARAETSFRQLAQGSHAAITQARAGYWLGRAEQEAGQDPQAAFRAAAAFPTTFYGQIAGYELGHDPADQVSGLHDPAYTNPEVWTFTGNELVRAALLLVAWGESSRARPFLLRATEVSPDPTTLVLSARLAASLGMPDVAVFIARRAGLAGVTLPDAGWPMPVIPPTGKVDPAVMLAVIRQESSFDRAAVSHAGARGLMQIMPATARALNGDVESLTDPERNMSLGQAYLGQLLDRYGGSVPMAAAAYNAGPRKVDDWVASNGDPRTGAITMIDWIELIGYGETRNYVQRVLENAVIYCARRGEPDTALIAQWMPAASVSARHEG